MNHRELSFARCAVFLFFFFTPVYALVYASDLSSGSFIIRDPVLGTGSGYSSSGSFGMQGSGNTNAQGYSSSAGFFGEYGFLYYPEPTASSQTITFGVSDATIGFGALASNAVRFASGAGTGSGTDVVAHTIDIETNAGSGYTLSYKGGLLVSGGNDINASTIVDDADGVQGAEQFGVAFSTSGDATIASGYDHNTTPANRDWKFIPNTTTTIVSETQSTTTETINVYYLANIASTTPAGVYATDITYILTGNF